jgi:hypothetical protein
MPLMKFVIFYLILVSILISASTKGIIPFDKKPKRDLDALPTSEYTKNSVNDKNIEKYYEKISTHHRFPKSFLLY